MRGDNRPSAPGLASRGTVIPCCRVASLYVEHHNPNISGTHGYGLFALHAAPFSALKLLISFSQPLRIWVPVNSYPTDRSHCMSCTYCKISSPSPGSVHRTVFSLNVRTVSCTIFDCDSSCRASSFSLYRPLESRRVPRKGRSRRPGCWSPGAKGLIGLFSCPFLLSPASRIFLLSSFFFHILLIYNRLINSKRGKSPLQQKFIIRFVERNESDCH